LRAHILRLMTRLQTSWEAPAQYTGFLADIHQRLAGPAADRLVELQPAGCRVTARGRAFLRNICMAFDARLSRRAAAAVRFSRTL
jgi:oxygen-independent coproporphyrinogen III oxidase